MVQLPYYLQRRSPSPLDVLEQQGPLSGIRIGLLCAWTTGIRVGQVPYHLQSWIARHRASE